ncbi:DUF1552 domain-containing protein [Tuwongella immobilis]|uniref:DUF1552 domain-containing protein n=1 Tax=Tuwongella immobilis TaxID=692036 RepID=A0A6C2YPZ5_9BACT|nr:DUF1552 domain-containing protein [Tuwongella immobilis]VIP03700.1 Uncharacterized protein OS=Planctomyces limnophilus (strain ATCC 43296 / DSM 3776 / IFAM 1008 / 290) GN=Plim_0128 PE=4 SV=1: HXXSHH [Tuwongella immobilis]VTS04768.1 Uncharacterized protein OS=Planctomyces limnophilus (strain ATCC 43296 / DSM 3776 / IFAM 1008 / 290) GN=Plim_0128 PE=4 SV=1: HXXSHH [Tuwongella immobilis]
MPGFHPIDRRTFLRGSGAALALPFLEAMSSPVQAASPASKTTSGTPPTRMAYLYFPNGAWMPWWTPTKPGKLTELSPSLKPLEKVKDSVLVVSRTTKKHSYIGDGHYAKTANFLTGLPVVKTTGKSISVGGPSVDQLAASKIGHLTPLPSLELGTDPVISGIDSNVGYTRLYGSFISWRTASMPVAREIHPRFVYERLFGPKDAQGNPVAGVKRADDQMLLDLAMDDAKSLRKKLGRDDQFKLDEYLDAVRSVEKRLEFFSKTDPREWKPDVPKDKLVAPAERMPEDFREHIRIMLDMMLLAFWTDTTRIATFMFANDVSGRNFSFVDGVKGGHHDLSHHSNEAAKIDQYARINRWHVQQFAEMLEKMAAIREGNGTLLDHSMILFGSGMSDGNAHDPNNLPIIIGGKGGNRLATGQHIETPQHTPLCNVLLTMLHAAGLNEAKFGDSTGVLANALVAAS